MSLFSALTGISALTGAVFGDQMAYHHAATDDYLTVVAFRKDTMEVRDPIGGPTRFQDVTWFRVTSTLPWTVTELTGDSITDLDGAVWYVTNAQRKASGITHLYVRDTPVQVAR